MLLLLHRRMWEEQESGPAGPSLRPDDDDHGDDEHGTGNDDMPRDPLEWMEQLSRYMSGGVNSPLRQYQTGRLDPFGQSGSDSWYR